MWILIDTFLLHNKKLLEKFFILYMHMRWGNSLSYKQMSWEKSQYYKQMRGGKYHQLISCSLHNSTSFCSLRCFNSRFALVLLVSKCPTHTCTKLAVFNHFQSTSRFILFINLSHRWLYGFVFSYMIFHPQMFIFYYVLFLICISCQDVISTIAQIYFVWYVTNMYTNDNIISLQTMQLQYSEPQVITF